MVQLSQLCKKEVINVNTGARLGFIDDITLDVKNGHIETIIVAGDQSFLFFGKCEQVEIAWCDIVKIGEDTILVDSKSGTMPRSTK